MTRSNAFPTWFDAGLVDVLGGVNTNSRPGCRISLTALIAASRGGVLKYYLIILFIYFISEFLHGNLIHRYTVL